MNHQDIDISVDLDLDPQTSSSTRNNNHSLSDPVEIAARDLATSASRDPGLRRVKFDPSVSSSGGKAKKVKRKKRTTSQETAQQQHKKQQKATRGVATQDKDGTYVFMNTSSQADESGMFSLENMSEEDEDEEFGDNEDEEHIIPLPPKRKSPTAN